MKTRRFVVAGLLAIGLLWGGIPAAQAQVAGPAQKPAAELSEQELYKLGEGIAFPYDLLENVLTKYGDKKGSLFYAKLKGDNDLETFVRAVAVAHLGPDKFPVFQVPIDEKDPDKGNKADNSAELAFWINAYNALRIKAIADAYPINELTQIKDLETAKTRVVAGQSYSFPELRKKIAAIDPRALFMLMSGDKSGPRAPIAAARFAGLGVVMNATIRGFVDDETRVTAPTRLANEVTVSPWLQSIDEYFGSKASRRKWNGIRAILSAYTTNRASRSYFTTSEYEVKFMPADSHVNELLSKD